jgi:hypothetical protein
MAIGTGDGEQQPDQITTLAAALRTIMQRGFDALPSADLCADEVPDWHPPSTLCHDCADVWILARSGDRPVRGWLLDGAMGSRCRFVAHSMVRTSDGALVDVTLARAPYERRFIEHPADVAGFFALLCANPPAHELFVDVD